MLTRVARISSRSVATGRVASARKVHTSIAPEAAGKIKWFNASKGFGFISQEGGADIFVHHTAVQAEGFKILNEGDEVEYDVQDAQDGKVAAANVKVLKTSVTDEQREAFAERANARREMMSQRRESADGGFRPRGRGGFRGRGRGGFRGGRGGYNRQEGEQQE